MNESMQASKKNLWNLLLWWLLGACFEFPLLACFATVETSAPPWFCKPWPALAAHAALPFALYFAAPFAPNHAGKKNAWNLIAALLTLFLPVAGWLLGGLFFTMVQTQFIKERAKRTIRMNEAALGLSYRPPPPFVFPIQLSREEKIRESIDLIPIIDILNGEDINFKRAAIEKLAKLATPSAVSILLNYRCSHALQVRFFATSSLHRIKKQFDDQLEAAKLQLEKQQDTPAARLFLAKTYLHYIQVGLLDTTTQEVYRKEALSHLLFCFNSGHQSAEVYKLILQIYSEQPEWEKELALLHSLEGTSDDSEEIQQMKAKVLYETQRFSEMVEMFSTLQFQDRKLKNIAQWWKTVS
ncbi:MAG TPA: hypothetical protein DF383_04410 [Deltaproteobacteria bacterium]|nr:hypothetical protein [Deltaproteobacteria bacterium]